MAKNTEYKMPVFWCYLSFMWFEWNFHTIFNVKNAVSEIWSFEICFGKDIDQI